VGSVINLNGKWRAQVRRKGHPSLCKTFELKAQADAWVRQTEADIDRSEPVALKSNDATVANLIDVYRDLRDRVRPISDKSTEHYTLKTLKDALGKKVAAKLTPDDLVAFAADRRDAGAGPYTINMDISKLGTVLRYSAASMRISLPDVVGSARPLLNHLRLIGGGGRRERRPEEDELTRIINHVREHRGDKFADALIFAASSAMRRGEICSLKWADINEETRIASVMRKHPRKGKELERVPILSDAWAVLKRQPKDSADGRIFPMDPTTLSKYFTWACTDLEIPDLHLHDLRHEGTSRLFESGLEIQEVAMVTGHKSWAMLKRYTQLKPEALTQKDMAPKPPPRASRPSKKPRP
jgi:integrase